MTSSSRTDFNIMLIGVATSALFFIAAIRPSILENNMVFTLQLICAIPLLLSSTIASRRTADTRKPEVFDAYATYLSVLGYALIINAVGILVAIFANRWAAVIFFTLNIITPLVYSYLRVTVDRYSLSVRVLQDSFFILIIIAFGLAVVL
ncbi:MAG: hypothetical protein AAB490_03325 [Patescibacteria group bacterium]